MKRSFSGLAALLALVALGLALGVLVPRGGAPGPHNAPHTRAVLVLSNAIHTDIALPLDPMTREAFDFIESAGLPISRPDAEWIMIGWGGETFYVNTPTWSDLEFMPVIRSILGDRSVLRVGLTGAIDPEAPFVRAVPISDARYRDMLDAILQSFRTGDSTAPTPLAVAGYGAFDRFYPAKGSFQALFGCNTWTGDMLRRAGITTGFWTPLPLLLDASLDLHADDGRPEGNR
ncbi:probable urease-associated protein [Fulvimarina pelagi HTCC2506]|uniref:Probable urease-associated protein n=1 Tax=Fulvimarina pelagi HTCC2506 TaxID=314231 RepID=Q0G525_9HYPH|nr:TIGR02117 family protein [Fulvimarina pelagi]EAU43239.1 probable urease-associated protein [Fulvimarina pelagi HTCC2506]